ncbi:type II secretion system protein F [Orenia metallireducens]|uniref:Type II secretion system protein F n=1 Tax=Orenia metallireducens TaxID=1413210 RepID=A0A1C0ACN0_9FIRM|nr:type II secretion system F family protein [Orenia metallireducens]OCL28140.1 type II secretion system protein F [Orenia metallireducens]
MAEFVYKARNTEGSSLEGLMDADNEQIVAKRLRDKGYYIISIKKYEDRNIHINFKAFTRVTLKDLAVFCRQFSTMINAGISLVRSLDILLSQSTNLKLKETILSIKEKVEGGMALSKALEEEKKVFPRLFISMVAAGEAGGLLDESLEEVAAHLENENEMKQKVTSALVYPIIISIVSVFVVIFLTVGVLPTFVDMFAGMDMELPAITEFVLASSDFLSSYWWFVLAILGVGVGAIYSYYRIEQGRRNIDKLLLKVPLIGDLSTKLATARFSKTLSVLISSGVPIIESLDIVAKIMTNRVVAENILEAKKAITEGESMVLPLRHGRIFPKMLLQMVKIGEETGRLDEMLLRVSGFYEKEVENKVNGMVSLIEPLLIVGLGIVVGGIVLSIMLPMFNMLDGI